MLNALLPGTRVPIHRHPESTENVLLLTGKLAEVFYEEERLGDGLQFWNFYHRCASVTTVGVVVWEFLFVDAPR